MPETSLPGQFSAAPKIRPDGADAAGDGKGLTVPDLYVRGDREAKPDLIAQAFAAPTSPLTLRAAARIRSQQNQRGYRGAPSHTAASGANPGAVKVSNAPDPRFNGRDIYMMAIQMPNLTSYSGSWLMWYADRTAREVGLAPVSPPVAYRKVDPKYIATAAADRVEGKVQLACVISKDGHVSNVELVRGLDDRLNQSAEEALAKWGVYPGDAAWRAGGRGRRGREFRSGLRRHAQGALLIAGIPERQHLIFDADDTLWENNIYFEQAFDDFCNFLNRFLPHAGRDSGDPR